MNWRMAQHCIASLNWKTWLLTTGVIKSALTLTSHSDMLVRRKQRIMEVYNMPCFRDLHEPDMAEAKKTVALYCL